MKRLFWTCLTLALALLAGPASSQGPIVGPGNIILCISAAQLPAGPTTITQIIAAVPGKAIQICGWHVTNTAAAGTFSFQIGTGSNCGTGTITVVPALSVSNTAPVTDHIDYAFLSVPTNTALCITPSVATISAVIYFNQF